MYYIIYITGEKRPRLASEKGQTKRPLSEKKGSVRSISAALLAEKFLNAVGAHVLALEIDHVLGVITEDAGRLIFL